ncbi:hypothetical protein [Streptomyces vinaceus]|uniref:hypothetical protein n=1 Tax=Streptomyces vinaceus TaxID=1960 RepID=UPI00142EF42B|nr:hypothetical protein [Streptomyces vinaceus]GHE56881.1 hypothetical protein GCM10017778_46460 [Streptomyces vinaceus]
MARGLTGLGFSVRFGVTAASVARDADTAEVTVETDDGAALRCDELLVAVGRRPRTADLGLETLAPRHDASGTRRLPPNSSSTPTGTWSSAAP